MANSRSTRSALLVSLVSIVLCCAVFVGTTFAWLSERTASKANLLQGGNLELVMYKGVPSADGISYTQQVTDTTRLFDTGTPWRPGGSQTVYLKLENKGRVPLQYELNLYAGAEVESVGASGPIVLSDLLCCSVSESTDGGVQTAASLSKLKETNAGVIMTDYQSVGKANGTLAAGQATYLTLVVYLPADADINCLPGQAVPSLEFGVTLAVAQQSETDMFGYNPSNALATTQEGDEGDIPTVPLLPEVAVVSGEEAMTREANGWKSAIHVGGTLYLPDSGEETAPTFSFEQAPLPAGVPVGVTDGVRSYLLSMDNTGDKTATVTLPVPAGAWDVSLYLDSTPLTRREDSQKSAAMEVGQYDYNVTDNTVTFLVEEFPAAITLITHSPALTVNGVGYAGLAKAFAVEDEVVLSNDLRLSAPAKLENAEWAKTLNLGGNILAGGFTAGDTGNDPDKCTIYVGAGSLTLQGGRVIAPQNGYCLYVDGQGTVTVESGEYSGGVSPFLVGPGGSLTITGGVFVNFDPTYYVPAGYQVTVNGDVYTVSVGSASDPAEGTPPEAGDPAETPEPGESDPAETPESGEGDPAQE